MHMHITQCICIRLAGGYHACILHDDLTSRGDQTRREEPTHTMQHPAPRCPAGTSLTACGPTPRPPPRTRARLMIQKDLIHTAILLTHGREVRNLDVRHPF